jgi:tRNA-uridine 2-sulfurtransferase
LGSRVVVGMSGGVDSAVAAALLKQQGHEVIGVSLNLAPKLADDAIVRDDVCCSLAAVEDARRVAAQLGIDHYSLNLREPFAQKIISGFVEEYLRGRTPNPCIRCNEHVKFAALYRYARALGADRLATGHYARVRQDPLTGRHILQKGVDPQKDQSYMLYVLDQDVLGHVLFPLGELTKPRTREIASEFGLTVANRHESQEICFVPDRSYGDFLRRTYPDTMRPGPIVDQSGHVLGQHKGLAFHTVGQRHGLGIASSSPIYVIALDSAANTVTVGPEDALLQDDVLATDARLIAVAAMDEPVRVQARLRHRMPLADGWLEALPDRGLRLRLDQPRRAIAPGQAMVCYGGDDVVAGGTIVSASRSEVPRQAAPA